MDLIDINNKKLNNDIKNEPINIDYRFLGIKPKKEKKEILTRNGRVYKKLNNQYGMWADNGKVFKL